MYIYIYICIYSLSLYIYICIYIYTFIHTAQEGCALERRRVAHDGEVSLGARGGHVEAPRVAEESDGAAWVGADEREHHGLRLTPL